jgi:hypothetical protein
MLPAVARSDPLADGSRARWPEPLVLQLGGPTLALAGRVVDTAGAPVAGVDVYTADGENFGTVEMERGGKRRQWIADLEDVLRGEDWRGIVKTDNGGAFELRGLLAHPYRLDVVDRRTLSYTQTAPLDPRAPDARSLTLVLDTGRVAPVAGRLVDRAGAPIAGATVQPERESPPRPAREGGYEYMSPLVGVGVKTDERGRFELASVAADVHALRLRSKVYQWGGVVLEIPPDADRTELELVAPSICRARAELVSDAGDVDWLIVLDGRGRELQLGGMFGVPIVGGRTEFFEVSDEAATVVLKKGAREVRRATVKLQADQPNVLVL